RRHLGADDQRGSAEVVIHPGASAGCTTSHRRGRRPGRTRTNTAGSHRRTAPTPDRSPFDEICPRGHTMTDQLTQQDVNNTAWAACDTFRGVIDPAQYKDYILVMLFLKYI